MTAMQAPRCLRYIAVFFSRVEPAPTSCSTPWNHPQCAPRFCSSNCLETASPASRLKSASAPSVVGAGLGRDAGDAVFLDYGVDAIASKLCSHSGEPAIDVRLYTVGAKLARERPVQVAHNHRISHSATPRSAAILVAAEGCVTGSAVYPVPRGVCDATWRPLLGGGQSVRTNNQPSKSLPDHHPVRPSRCCGCGSGSACRTGC
ncbi:hypothetical protein ACVW0A_005585 [Pseudomonas sp. TE3610]